MSEKKRPRIWLIVVLPVLLFISFLFATSWIVDPMVHASRQSTYAIRHGMVRKDVTEILGVMYDDYSIGKYPGVDVIAEKMNDGNTITTMCCWNVARSRDRFWVGFDADGNVVDTMEQLSN